MSLTDRRNQDYPLSRRNVLLASSAFIAASALRSTTVVDVAHAQAAVTQSAIAEQEAHAIAVDAYLYFYSLISMDITRRVAINVEPGKRPGLGPANMFNNFTAFPTANFKTVVRPNFDTLYPSAFLDMTKEPVIVSAPDLYAPRSDALTGKWNPPPVTRVATLQNLGGQ